MRSQSVRFKVSWLFLFCFVIIYANAALLHYIQKNLNYFLGVCLMAHLFLCSTPPYDNLCIRATEPHPNLALHKIQFLKVSVFDLGSHYMSVNQ